MEFQREEELLNRIKAQLDKKESQGPLAAFDADGTLWAEDANDILMGYERRESLRDLKDLLDPAYQKEGMRYKRCQIFAERQAGFFLEEFREHCRQALKESPLHVFSFQKKLLKFLKEKGMEIVIVTASVQWMVEEAVKMYQLPVDQVLGVRNRLEGDLITGELIQTPFKKAKGEVLLNYSGGEACFLAAGNTLTDLPLLEMAKIPIVVHSASSQSPLFATESRLKEQALEKAWILFEKAGVL